MGQELLFHQKLLPNLPQSGVGLHAHHLVLPNIKNMGVVFGIKMIEDAFSTYFLEK